MTKPDHASTVLNDFFWISNTSHCPVKYHTHRQILQACLKGIQLGLDQKVMRHVFAFWNVILVRQCRRSSATTCPGYLLNRAAFIVLGRANVFDHPCEDWQISWLFSPRYLSTLVSNLEFSVGMLYRVTSQVWDSKICGFVENTLGLTNQNRKLVKILTFPSSELSSSECSLNT